MLKEVLSYIQNDPCLNMYPDVTIIDALCAQTEYVETTDDIALYGYVSDQT